MPDFFPIQTDRLASDLERHELLHVSRHNMQTRYKVLFVVDPPGMDELKPICRLPYSAPLAVGAENSMSVLPRSSLSSASEHPPPSSGHNLEP
ncbi:MAG: hypothetical protein R3E96_10835 [Planctomycetota bacterium]